MRVRISPGAPKLLEHIRVRPNVWDAPRVWETYTHKLPLEYLYIPWDLGTFLRASIPLDDRDAEY